MHSSIWPLYRQIWIILVGVICQSVLIQSCRSSIKDPMLAKDSEKKIWPLETTATDLKIESFSEYLHTYYDHKITTHEISLILNKWKEFDEYYHLFPNSMNKINIIPKNSKLTIQKKCPCNIPTKVKRKRLRRKFLKHRKVQTILPSSLSVLKNMIDNREETNLIVSIKGSNRKKKEVIPHIYSNRVYSLYEAKMALNATDRFSHPEFGACKLQNKSFCMEKYFSFKQENNDLIYFYPPSITVNRCSQDQCHCLKSNQECIATSTKSRQHYVIGHDEKYQLWTWTFYITDHVQCKCQPKCFMRNCIAPFSLRVFNNGNGIQSCECMCPIGKERKCNQILIGKKKFSKTDYNCIVTGKCLKPQCLHYSLSEENLYNRRCPG